MLELELPGSGNFHFEHVVFDLNGTLAQLGVIADSTRTRLRTLNTILTLHVITADTHGRLDQAIAGLPVQAQRIQGLLGAAEKRALVEALGAQQTIAVGNGRNDVAMLQAAALGVAVMGVEGLAVAALHAADIMFPDIDAALDSLITPLRLVATLRG